MPEGVRDLDQYPKDSGDPSGLQRTVRRVCASGLPGLYRRSACWPWNVTSRDENPKDRFELESSEPRGERIPLSDRVWGVSDMTREKTRTTGGRCNLGWFFGLSLLLGRFQVAVQAAWGASISPPARARRQSVHHPSRSLAPIVRRLGRLRRGRPPQRTFPAERTSSPGERP